MSCIPLIVMHCQQNKKSIIWPVQRISHIRPTQIAPIALWSFMTELNSTNWMDHSPINQNFDLNKSIDKIPS
jgi:hypothetical protein